MLMEFTTSAAIQTSHTSHSFSINPIQPSSMSVPNNLLLDDAELGRWLDSSASATTITTPRMVRKKYEPDTHANELLKSAFKYLDPPQAVFCTICRDPFSDPLETTCGHVFCSSCIETWVTSHKKSCPLCSQAIESRHLRPVNRVLSAIIDDLQVKCNTCKVVLPRGEIEAHVETCSHTPDTTSTTPTNEGMTGANSTHSIPATKTSTIAATTTTTTTNTNTTTSNITSALASDLMQAPDTQEFSSSESTMSAWQTPNAKVSPRAFRPFSEERDGAKNERSGWTTNGWSTPEAHTFKSHLRSTETQPLQQGLLYKYYRGAYNKLPNFDLLVPQTCDVTDGVNLLMMMGTDAATPNVLSFEEDESETQRKKLVDCAVRFEGFIRIPTPGKYIFTVGSNDGSLLKIRNQVVVNMDKTQYFTEETGIISLDKGDHAFEVSYFYRSGKLLEATGVRSGAALSVKYGVQGTGWMNSGGFGPIDIPVEMLYCPKDAQRQAENAIAESTESKETTQLRLDNMQLSETLESANARVHQLERKLLQMQATKVAAEKRAVEAERSLSASKEEVTTLQARAQSNNVAHDQETHRLQARVHTLQADSMQKEEEELILRQQHFHAVALSLKLQAEAEGCRMNVSIAELFAMSESANIPVQDWARFIRNKLREDA